VIFSSNIIKTPESLRDRAKKNREREKKKRKMGAPSVSSNKGEVNILRGEKHFNFKNLFYVIPFSPPPSYHFKKPFQNH
jgi:hypothetical protein